MLAQAHNQDFGKKKDQNGLSYFPGLCIFYGMLTKDKTLRINVLNCNKKKFIC